MIRKMNFEKNEHIIMFVLYHPLFRMEWELETHKNKWHIHSEFSSKRILILSSRFTYDIFVRSSLFDGQSMFTKHNKNMSYANRDDTTEILLFGDDPSIIVKNIKRATSNLIACDKKQESHPVPFISNTKQMDCMWMSYG